MNLGLTQCHLFYSALVQRQCLCLDLWFSCKDNGTWNRKEATVPCSINVCSTSRATGDHEGEVNYMNFMLSAWDLTGVSYGIWHWEVSASIWRPQWNSGRERLLVPAESASFWMRERSTRLFRTGSKGFFWHLNAPWSSAI